MELPLHIMRQLIETTTLDIGISKNKGTPKSSILIGFSPINHPFSGSSIFGNTHIQDPPKKKNRSDTVHLRSSPGFLEGKNRSDQPKIRQVTDAAVVA